jgi:DNA-3-methyladenine glycosylase
LKIGGALPKSFFLQDTVEVARQLLGKGLYLLSGDTPLLVEITEVEAYLGVRDPASHAYRGLKPRNWAMFERGGTCYVYLSYGINFCMNVSTQPKGIGEAILFRAGAPLLGIETMAKNRGLWREGEPVALRNLLSGPGKICQALGIDLGFNGRTFDKPSFKLVDLGNDLPSRAIDRTPRIGITKAKDELLRFSIKGSPWLSRKA